MSITTLSILSSQENMGFRAALCWADRPVLFGMLLSIVPLDSRVLHIKSECDRSFVLLFTEYALSAL